MLFTGTSLEPRHPSPQHVGRYFQHLWTIDRLYTSAGISLSQHKTLDTRTTGNIQNVSTWHTFHAAPFATRLAIQGGNGPGDGDSGCTPGRTFNVIPARSRSSGGSAITRPNSDQYAASSRRHVSSAIQPLLRIDEWIAFSCTGQVVSLLKGDGFFDQITSSVRLDGFLIFPLRKPTWNRDPWRITSLRENRREPISSIGIG